jgi:hypothetical protein
MGRFKIAIAGPLSGIEGLEDTMSRAPITNPERKCAHRAKKTQNP